MLHVASISFTFPPESSHFTSDGDSGYVAFGMSVFALDFFLFGKTKLQITARQGGMQIKNKDNPNWNKVRRGVNVPNMIFVSGNVINCVRECIFVIRDV